MEAQEMFKLIIPVVRQVYLPSFGANALILHDGNAVINFGKRYLTRSEALEECANEHVTQEKIKEITELYDLAEKVEFVYGINDEITGYIKKL